MITRRGFAVRGARVALAALAVVVAFAAAAQAARAQDPVAQVINGDVVPNNPALYPYVVQVLDQYGDWFCGGSLIAPRWVVTAGHCSGPGSEPTYVRAGSKTQSGGQVIGVARANVHEYFDLARSLRDDIQLLKLDSDATATPIALIGGAGEDPADNASAQIAGWGVYVPGYGNAYSNDLRDATVSVIANGRCHSQYYVSEDIADSMLCAANFAGALSQATCFGDSGGPLVTTVGGVPKLTGVTSWSYYCPDSYDTYPGVFTRVSSYLDWIAAQMDKTASFPRRSYDFGGVATNASPQVADLQVSSRGENAVTISGFTVSGDPSFKLVSQTCTAASPLATGESCDVKISFTPGKTGPLQATLAMASNSTDGGVKSIPIGATGSVPLTSTPSGPVKLHASQIGRSVASGGRRVAKLRFSYRIPSGVKFSDACLGKLAVTGKVPHVGKAVKTSGGVSWSGASCVLVKRLRLPRSARGKRVAFTMRFAGNAYIPVSTTKQKLRIK